MMAFIDQEANEKVEEIDAKVCCFSAMWSKFTLSCISFKLFMCVIVLWLCTLQFIYIVGLYA